MHEYEAIAMLSVGQRYDELTGISLYPIDGCAGRGRE
jgi:hypothetical protein